MLHGKWRPLAASSSIFFLAAVLPLLAGCGQPAPQPKPAEIDPRPAIGVSLWTTGDSWHAQMKVDIEAAAAKHPQVRLVLKDAKNNAEQQMSDLGQLLADGVKAIIVSPQNAQTLAEPLAKAFDAGIPVVVVDRPIIGGKYSCFIAPNNKQIGTAVAKWLAGRLGGKGKIVEIKGPVDSVQAQEGHEAFRAALLDPGYRFVYENCVDPPRVDAGQLMREAIERTEQIDAVFAHSDEAAQDAYETAKAAGREKGVLFIGVNALPEIGRQFVAAGGVDASFLRPTCGADAFDAAVKLLAGQQVPKSILLDTRLFTKENIEQGGEPIGKP